MTPTSHTSFPREPMQGHASKSQEPKFYVLDLIPDKVCVVKDDRTVAFLNRAMRERFGDHAGRKCSEAPFSSPEVCDSCPFWTGMGKAEYPHVRNVRTRGGAVLEITANRLEDEGSDGTHLVSVVRDVTRHGDSETEVQRLASSIDQLGEAVVFIDNDGRIAYANAAFISMMGSNRASVIGSPISEVTEASSMEIPMDEMLQREGDSGWSSEATGSWGDDSEFFIRIDARPVRDGGRGVIGTVATFRDVTRERLEKAETESYRSQLEKRMDERTSELAHRVNQLTTINKISRVLTSIMDPTELMAEFTDAIADGFRYPLVTILLWDRDRGELVARAGSGSMIGTVPPDHRLQLKAGIIGHAAYLMETLVTGDVDADPRYIRGGSSTTKSEISVPLTYRGELLGVLDVQSDRRDAFTRNDVTVLEMLADILTSAMVSARTFNELRDREKALSVLDRISKQISMRLEPSVVLEQVARDAAALLNAEKALVGIVDLKRDFMDWVALYNVDDVTMEELRQTVEMGVTGRVLKQLRTEIVNDYTSDPDAVPRDAETLGIRQMMSAPLLSGGQAIGVVSVYNKLGGGRFREDDAAILTSLAGHAAVALENANLLAALNRRVHSQLMLLETAVSIQRMIDSSSMYQVVAEKLREVVPYDSITVYMVDRKNRLMIPVVSSGKDAALALKERFPMGEGISGHVAITGVPEIVNNTFTDERAAFVAGTETDKSEEALLAVPLKGRELVIGVITLYRESGAEFSTEDRDFALLFASQAAVAVENSELYSAKEQLLGDSRNKIAQMGKVLELTTSVMYMGDLEAVLQRVTDAVVESFGFRKATVSLLDRDRREFVLSAQTGYPHWVGKGIAFDADTLLDGFRAEFRVGETAHFLPYEKQRFGIEQFFFVEHPELADIPRPSPDVWHERDLLMFSLKDQANHLIGYMLVDDPEDGSVPQKSQLEVLEVLAGIASIAVVNSRLFESQVDAVNEIALLNDLMTHDINNFNQGIMGYVELLLQDRDLTDDQRKFAESALVQVRNNARLIENMRMLAKVRATSEDEFTPQDIGRAVDEAVADVKKVHSDRDIVVESAVPPGRHFVMASTTFREMFTNLLSNAVKFDSSNRVRVDVSVESESISENEYWLVSVYDRGRGIPDDRKKTVFERFATGLTGIKGFGLGLSIVSTMVEKFNGKVWVEDRVEGDHTKGAVFKVLLPRADVLE
ncbi:MAG: GAF domain-containing protein [Methanobacteriota archaeon]|nr:MAG: GAF domain-containing protein [Euryarchaeota archaeon]